MIGKIFKSFRGNSPEGLFAKDLLLSERLRVQMLLVLFVIILAFVLVFFFTHGHQNSFLLDRTTVAWLTICLILFTLYEFGVYLVIKMLIKTSRHFPEFGRFGNTAAEITMPTIIIIVLTGSVNPLYALNGPAAYAYFVFIILSTLRLDFRLSFFAGLLAAVEYATLGMYYIAASTDSIPFFNSNTIIVEKSLILVLCGIAAGKVSEQVKKRMVMSLKVVEERNRILNVFGQQVSPEIVDELLNKKEEEKGILKEVCVMFLDIRNFTSLVGSKDPKEIVAYQDKVFGLSIDIINKHKGIINQFLGDGFMATFGAPVYRGNDCQNAVNAALEIVDELNRAAQDGLIIPTRVGIGIHFGEAVTGNVGTSLRKQYSITGSVVILATRIEQMNKELGTQILISKEVFNNSEIPGAAYVGPVNIKGREEQIEIYKLDNCLVNKDAAIPAQA